MDQEIINKYLSGYSINKLLLEYPTYNRRQINKLFRENQITIRGGRKKREWTEQDKKEIEQMIENGAFIKDISKKFKCSKETLTIKMEEWGIKLKTKSHINRHIKQNYFSIIDAPEKAYWLGFLFTDGSVGYIRNSKRIRLQLQEKDLEILERFKEDLGLENKIIYDQRPNSVCCSVEFICDQIFDDLGKYDIVPNKTYLTSHIPYKKIPQEYWPAFALGLLDGDGSIFVSKNCSTDVSINYTAYHESEVEDFQNLINSIANINHKNKNFYTSAWHTQWRGRLQVLKILDILYNNCPRHLQRKYDIYLRLKNSLN